MNVEWLASTEGADVIKRAHQFNDALTASTNLRKEFANVSTELISQAMTQAKLQQNLASRWGTDTTALLLTDDGISQATRPRVAHYRAQWLKRNFGDNARVLDLTCGLGFDALAMAEAGLDVQAIELDTTTALMASHNLKSAGVTVQNADATEVDISNVDVIFVDPARRNPNSPRKIDGTTRRIFNPHDWSPSWEFITSLSKRIAVVAKVAPGIDEETIADWDAQWISEDGDIVEAMLSSEHDPNADKRQAVLLTKKSDEFLVFTGSAEPPIAEIGSYLVCPDGAITRAGALDTLAHIVNGGLVNEHIGWITTYDSAAVEQLLAVNPASADCFKIIGQTKCDAKAIAMQIKDLPASAITIMTRGVTIDVDSLRKKVSPNLDRTAPELVLALYREDAGNVALIARRITGQAP